MNPNFYNTVFATPANYMKRFLAFLAITQLLFLLMYILIRIFGWIEWFEAIAFTIMISFGIGLVTLIFILFKGVKAKALSFFSSGIIYLVFSIILARKIGTDISVTDMTFLGGWSTWNTLYSIVILLIGTFRTFFLGFVYDYKKKA
jgi:hypothetical protein